MALTLFIYGDVELNPGPKNTRSYFFSLCHWNLNSLPAHDFSKLSLFEAYNRQHNFDMTCLSETYPDSSYADYDTRLNLKDFTLIRADNPQNCRRGGVSSYFKEHLTVNFRDTLTPLCSCSIEVESTSHYFLRCHFFDALGATLMNDLRNIESDLPTLRDEYLTNILLSMCPRNKSWSNYELPSDCALLFSLILTLVLN